MYPRNNASPERIAVGQVVLISDGTVQTSGVSITVRGQGGAEAAGGGTTAYGADGTVYYTPTQAETNYTSFVVIASKASCFSASMTIITTAAATAGQVRLEGVTHTSAVIPTVTTLTNKTGFSLAATGLDAIASTATGMVEIAKAVWDRVVSKANHNIANSAGKFVRLIGGLMQLDGTISDAGPTVTDFDTDLTGYGDNYFIDAQLLFSNGSANGGLARPITGYTSLTGNFQFAAPDVWPVTPINTDDFTIIGLHTHPIAQIQSGLATEAKQDTAKTVIDSIKVDTASGGIPKNAIFNDFQFPMVLTSDHYTAATGKTVTGQRSLNGGAWASVTGTISEVGDGLYTIDLTAADTNGDTVSYKFSATDCDDTIVPTIITRS